MTLLEVAKWLKKEIMNNSSKQNLNLIIQKLNGMDLTKKETAFLQQYCCSAGYDEKTKSFLLCESDNSEFLKYVDYVFARLENGESN